MSELLLSADTGRQEGTRPSRRLRREGKVPAIVYGLDADPVAVSVDWPELRRALTTDAGLNAVITLRIEGEDHLSVIRDLQRHPVRRDVIHVDFLRVRADQEIEAEVPLVLVGEATLVLRADGMVDQTMYHLTINAKPAAVPDEIEVDISDLDLGGSVKVSDVVLPAGVSTDVDADEAIANAVITRSTREAMAADAAEGADGEGEVAGDAPAESTDD